MRLIKNITVIFKYNFKIALTYVREWLTSAKIKQCLIVSSFHWAKKPINLIIHYYTQMLKDYKIYFDEAILSSIIILHR